MRTKTKSNRRQKKSTAKNESKLALKKGMLGKFVSKSKQQTLRMEKAKKKDRRNPQTMFSQKGLMDKSHIKNGILKWKTKENKEEKQNGKKRKI